MDALVEVAPPLDDVALERLVLLLGGPAAGEVGSSGGRGQRAS